MFEKSIGGRDALVAALEVCTLDSPQTKFLQLLCDPRRRKDSIAKLCHDAGISQASVIDLFRSSTFAMAHAVSVGIIAESMPEIVRDVTDKSVDMTINCPICTGVPPGSYPMTEGGLCVRCKGTQKITRLADFDRQRMLFETAGLLKKDKGGLSVQIGVSQTVGSIPVPVGAMSEYVNKSDGVAYAIDAEVVKEPKPDDTGPDPTTG